MQFLPYNTDQVSNLHSIVFEKDVRIENSFEFGLSNCVFKGAFRFASFDNEKFVNFKKIYPNSNVNRLGRVRIYNSEFHDQCRIINSSASLTGKDGNDQAMYFGNNIFIEESSGIFILGYSMAAIHFGENTFNSSSPYYIQFEQFTNGRIENNNFNNGLPEFYCIEIDELYFKDNQFNVPSLINFKPSNSINFIGADQFRAPVSSLDGYREYVRLLDSENQEETYWDLDNETTFNDYNTNERIENLTAYQFELDQKSVFYNYFRDKHNMTEANKFYIEIKDLESQRLSYEYNLNPTFTTFFKIQINKFLKLFSNYGTEPERAVLVSIYVILFFAIFYLFFPNSWDKHGKNRIMDRYRFFTKYMNKEAGIHQVYLEERKEELLASEDFKNYMLSSKKRVPKFFLATAMPLYAWSVSGTKLSAAFLRRIDIMNGSWQDLPQHKRLWKSILLVGAFIIAITYDLFIKMLNALMLSINTFTTLGFGEIPIKGLPRYLAIIQGFIGWFMLTIFSVSLISQLLN